jgi:hypothetical protein
MLNTISAALLPTESLRARSIYKAAKWLGDGILVVEKSYGHLAPADRDIDIDVSGSVRPPFWAVKAFTGFRQIRAEPVGLLRTMLAAQMGLPELPASFYNPDSIKPKIRSWLRMARETK